MSDDLREFIDATRDTTSLWAMALSERETALTRRIAELEAALMDIRALARS